jgi:esterase/lipase superfamily enzyme
LKDFHLKINGDYFQTNNEGLFFYEARKKKHQIKGYGHLGFDTILKVKSNSDTVRFYAIKNIDSVAALYDLSKGKITFYCHDFNSLAPMGKSEHDKLFEKAYDIKYIIIGCIVPGSKSQKASYNRTVALYLDEKYGTGWRKLVRHDVTGVATTYDQLFPRD